jgi:hypothetical protein
MYRTLRKSSDEQALRTALRVTGNAAFVLFALAFAVKPSRALWRGFLATHAVHASLLVRLTRARRGGPAPFTATSRYGGAVGYATIAALTATGYLPGKPARGLHRAGETVLFALFAFTIVHGYLAKGRDARVYAPLGALWFAAAARAQRINAAPRPEKPPCAPARGPAAGSAARARGRVGSAG